MNQIGVIFHMNTILPEFGMFSGGNGRDIFEKVRSHLEDHGFHSLATDQIHEPMKYISMIEDDFFRRFGLLSQDMEFFRNLIWLQQHMPEIRLKLRNDLQLGVPIEETVEKIKLICAHNTKAQKMFTKYLKSITWDGQTLFSLEQDLDRIYMKILKESTGFLGKNAFKEYVRILDKQYAQDVLNREWYKQAEEGDSGTRSSSTSEFQDIAHEECRFVNKARIEYDPDLVILQCYVRYKFLFYNMKICISIPEEERSHELVNYSLHN